MSVESNSRFALVLLYSLLWLVKKSRATFSTNQKYNSKESRLARTRFPALGTVTYLCFEFCLVHWVICVCCDWLGLLFWLWFYDTHLKSALWTNKALSLGGEEQYRQCQVTGHISYNSTSEAHISLRAKIKKKQQQQQRSKTKTNLVRVRDVPPYNTIYGSTLT